MENTMRAYRRQRGYKN